MPSLCKIKNKVYNMLHFALVQGKIIFAVEIKVQSSLHYWPPVYNGHFFVTADGPYIQSYSVTSLQRTTTSAQQQRPLKRV